MNDWMKIQMAKARQDPKKLVLVGGLSLVMVVMWGRLLINQSPQQASASALSVPIAAAASPASPTRTPDKSAQRSTEDMPIVYVDLPESLVRDVFTLNRTQYPSVPEAPSTVQSRQSGPPAPTDEQMWKESARRALMGLELQTTMMGANPRAVISGRVLRPGEQINGFTLRQVQSRQVILEFEGRELQLGM